MSSHVWLLAICIILAILYIEKSYRLKKLKKLFSKMEHRFFKQQQHKEQFLAEMTKTDRATNVTLDSVTGLPDSQVFTDRLVQSVNQSQRHKMSFAVMRLGLNELAAINEEFGYEVGDKILVETAGRMKNVIRQVDTVTRYIGSHFVFLLPLLSKPETAAYVAQRAQDSIMKPYTIDGKEYSLTANVGISIYPADGEDADTLLKNAEIALQRSEQDERHGYQFFRKEMQVLGQRELSLTSTLRDPSVIDKMLVCYQPHIDVETNEIACVQAVLYLKHPDYGLIAFSDFYKLAENAGKITELGEWFLVTAIKQFKQWEVENFKPPMICVSVSLKQIENPRFLLKLSDVLEETGFDPQKIVFEISENILTEKSVAVDHGFSTLNRLGIKICIGIFALGHFTLSKLSNISIDYIKIDGKLIQDVLNHHENENILAMIISLAKDSQIKVVADGVEHKKQKVLLEQLGCTLMQGKLFALPQPANAVGHEYHSG